MFINIVLFGGGIFVVDGKYDMLYYICIGVDWNVVYFFVLVKFGIFVLLEVVWFCLELLLIKVVEVWKFFIG